MSLIASNLQIPLLCTVTRSFSKYSITMSSRKRLDLARRRQVYIPTYTLPGNSHILKSLDVPHLPLSLIRTTFSLFSFSLSLSGIINSPIRLTSTRIILPNCNLYCTRWISFVSSCCCCSLQIHSLKYSTIRSLQPIFESSNIRNIEMSLRVRRTTQQVPEEVHLSSPNHNSIP